MPAVPTSPPPHPASPYEAPLHVVPPTPAAEGPRCANCGAVAGRPFCAECGQEQHDLHRSLRGVLGELLDAFAGWDGKIPATFRLLLLRPGALTVEYLAGRRARYLRPLRVFLIASVALVLALQLPTADTGLRLQLQGGGEQIALGGGDLVATPAGAARDQAPASRRAASEAPVGTWERRIDDAFEARLAKLRALPPGEAQAMLKRAFLGRLGTTLFLLVPVFALLVRLLWRRAPYFYAEHAVFALHAHAQGMLAIALAHVLPTVAGALALAWAPAYLWVALRRVYGRAAESRARTTGKYVALVTTYGVVLALGLAATLLLALFVGG